ncbi:MAG: hypothetical protein IKE24_11860 [Clostridia bacterium]|nr:hypothetical protein [Clostridia bacterium]
MTTASGSAGRIRRSVRFAQVEPQRTPAAPQRQRFTEADHLRDRSFQNTQDWTGSMGLSPSGRFRVLEKGEKKEKPLTRRGIRKDWGRAALIVLAAVMTTVILVETAHLGLGQINIRKLNERIASMEVRNEELRETLARSSGDISVCTEAVKMNLVSSNGVRPIPLTAPTDARMVPTEQAVTTERGDIKASATGTQGD